MFTDMIVLFDNIGILEELGGKSTVLEWDATRAKYWRQYILDTCREKAVEELLSSLAHGKYSFLLHMIPDFDAPRPLHMTLGEAAGGSLLLFFCWSLFKWLLSSHSLEVETGRYEGKPREQRFCQRCRRLIFCDIIGDERHALIECARGEEEKLNFQRKISNLLGNEGIVTVFSVMGHLPYLTEIQQKSRLERNCTDDPGCVE